MRDGGGGSPTVVVPDGSFTDEDRRAFPATKGTSHAVFFTVERDRVLLRFFTGEGELPACGHGTVAALAVLAERADVPDYRVTLSAGGREFGGRAVRRAEGFEASFDPGPVTLRDPTAVEGELIASLVPESVGPAVVASVGRPRVLVPVRTRADLDAFTPDLDRIREVCDRLGLLGCYVYTVPDTDGRVAARMFAPSIGVPEDVANANSTACLAAYLSRETLIVDMGDSLSSPATIIATTRPGPDGPRVDVGGIATT
ncbi:PhzF family phenazine biosynthesis protein [Kribbella sp. NBC_00709]|uniref:PhzF family phenazine biosynthesis protein n=1 Tax=Kribbella sp. NBC_00709 TaxID=2975972 RepID=UPI002E27DD89|nr:PhzF family phenazine biosynthesis protein [Kribbella sp. NBC_00709]